LRPSGVWLPPFGRSGDPGRYFHRSFGEKPGEKQAAIIAQGGSLSDSPMDEGAYHAYVGTIDGVPLVFHNFWSIRRRMTKGEREEDHRTFGHYHPSSRPGVSASGSVQGDFLGAVQGMTLLLQPSAVSRLSVRYAASYPSNKVRHLHPQSGEPVDGGVFRPEYPKAMPMAISLSSEWRQSDCKSDA